jgi:hypothetical protein
MNTGPARVLHVAAPTGITVGELRERLGDMPPSMRLTDIANSYTLIFED